MLEADPVAWRLMLERLMDETEDNLDAVSSLEGPERAQVVGDIEAELERLEAAYDLLLASTGNGAPVLIPTADPTGEIRLQASWAAGSIVVWAGGPDLVAHQNADLADRLEALGGPRLGWAVHADVVPPERAEGGGPLDPGRGGARLAGGRGRRRPGRRGRRGRQRPLAGPGGRRRRAARGAWAASSRASAPTATPRAR